MKRTLVVVAASLLLLLPFVLWAGVGIAGVLTLMVGIGVITAIKTLAKNDHAAVAVAGVAVVLTVCATIVLLAFAPQPPAKITQEDVAAKVATAQAVGRALAAVDVGNANARAVAAERQAANEHNERTKAERELVALKAQAHRLPSVRSSPESVAYYAAPMSPPPSWRSYLEPHLLIAGAFVVGTVRADCSQPVRSRPIEWSRDGVHFQPLRDAEYERRAEDHGALACS